MHEFDVEADEVLATIGEYCKDDKSRLRVSVRRLNGGPLKVHIERWYRSQKHPEWTFRKVGRYTLDEAEAIGKMLLQAAFSNEVPPAPKEDEIPW